MSNNNIDYKDSFLNDVNITSNIRAPGEYKYFYCGENNTETDKSFLVFSSMWYTDRVTENMDIICSTYNSINTAQLFFNKNTELYNLFIYKNIIDYRNENLSLKLLKIIKIIPKMKLDSQGNNIKSNNTIKNQTDKEYINLMNTKLYFASNNYILINELDSRILLVDINNGSFITIFSKNNEDKEIIYNIFDTYDEIFVVNGEQKIRTYAFLSMKYQDRKTPTYKYSYFTIQKIIDKTIHLYPINLDLGNSEPLCLKIARIIHRENKDSEQKCFFIFCFLSTTISLQLITDYDNLTLHQMFQKYCKINGERDDDLIKKNNNNINEDINIKKPKFWIGKSTMKMEKIQLCQGMKIALHINSKKICSLIYYFETKGIISYTFNYFDSPEEISKKIFILQREFNINSGLEYMKKNDSKIWTYNFLDCYQFKKNCFFGFSDKNLILGEKNVIHIYEENTNYPVYTYEFFQESLSALITLDGIGSTFILTGKKLFKIIYNHRYKIFSNEMLFTRNKIHYYKYNYSNLKKNTTVKDYDKPIFPLFEFKPEDIWNGYCNNLNIPPFIFTEDIYIDIEDEKEEEVEHHLRDEKYLGDNKNFSKKCVLCNKESELVCSDCGSRHYCCYEHFKYDYFSYHFFECYLIQFFKRQDIMSETNLEKRYKILYNELIKLSGRILNFIFRRIYTKYDYTYFLNMILILIDIFINFGFHINLSDFCWLNFNLSNDKRKSKNERVIFYLEALFYYVQLHFLKCTFALRGGLYNLTDCYIKIIRDDIIPRLTPKSNKRLISLKFEKIKKKIIYKNEYFSDFKSPLFFDIKNYVKFLGSNNYIDIIEEYIIKHLKSLSLLSKYKIKIRSNIEVQNTFVDINLMFDDHYSENIMYKNIVPYCYFSTSFYLVEIGKITQTVKLLRRMVGYNYDLNLDSKLCALTYYNLGLLQYALGNFDIGIHNIETSYKLIVINDFSDKMKFYVIDSLGLAYLNQKNLFKAYILIQTSVKERKKLDKQKYQIKCNRLNVYLNYIVDLYEYNFISKTRFLIKKKYKNYDKHKLIKFVLGEEDKELVISEQNLGQFIKVVEFIYKLSDTVLKQLNTDNPPKAPTSNREEIHHEKNISFNSDVSQISSTLIYKDYGNEKDELFEEYEEDIEVKTNLYDTLLSRQQQQEFKELKTIYLKRDIILRDYLGNIEKFNINFDPIYADEFQKIIEKLKINFLLKEIFYCFQNEKWRDELYNYNQNNILFGLSKYLKLEKVQNMMAIEKSKNIEMKKNEKKENKTINNLYDSTIEEENSENLSNINFEDDWLTSNNDKEDEENISSKNAKKLEERKYNNYKYKNMSYNKFKKKFITSLKEFEKENKNEDLFAFMNLDEDYLYTLYKNVYQNNPDQNFIFKNPLLILNYIYLEINKPDPTVPIIGSHNKILKSVMSKVKEEDTFSFNSLQDSKTSKKSETSEKKDEIKLSKKNRNSSSSSSTISKKKNSFVGAGSNSKSDESSNTEDNDNNLKIKKKIINSSDSSQKPKEEKDNSESHNKKFNDNNNKNNLNSNVSESFHSSEENKYNFKKRCKEFVIVSQEATFCFIPVKKIPTFILSAILKKEKDREKEKSVNRKPRRKTQIILPKTKKFNMIRDLKRKNSTTIVNDSLKEKTFIQELNRRLNFSKIYNEEEDEENKKNFAVIQRKNRIYPYRNSSKASLSDRKSMKSNIFSRKNSTNKNVSILKLTKKDIILGNYSNKKKDGNKTIIEKEYINNNKTNRKDSLILFNLGKELGKSKSKNNINKKNKNDSQNNYNNNKSKEKKEKSSYDEKNKDNSLYKNNSLIKHFIENSKHQNKKNKNNNILNNYSYYLNNKSNNNQRINNEHSFISNKINNYHKDYGFKTKNEIEKKIENEAKEYLKKELNNKKNLNKKRLINSSGFYANQYKNVLNKYKNNQKNEKKVEKENILKTKKTENKEKENEIIYSYIESMSNKMKEKEKKEHELKGLATERNNRNNVSRLNKKQINEIMKFNGKEKKYSQNYSKMNDNNINSNINSYTSRLYYNKKGKFDDSTNTNNIIFENSSYINNINYNSKYVTLNNSKSNIYKKRTNKSNEISNDNIINDNSDTKRLIQKYKLFPFLKKDNMRSKENSGMATLSNTNAHTPRSKRKIRERKNNSIIGNLSNIKKIEDSLIKSKK